MFFTAPAHARTSRATGKAADAQTPPVDTFRVEEYLTLAPHDLNREAQGETGRGYVQTIPRVVSDR
jgi:hypothetical protein